VSQPAFWLTFWLAIGVLGQAFFTARFLSLLGGVALLSYAISRHDPVIIVGQAMGLFVYTRNLMLVGKARRRAASA
jgi:lipid-A-disaccharide synthase-like uncharacterized protein